MSNNNANDRSVVKTSDLIYVFCAAAWVNVLTNNFADNSNYLCFILAFLTFAIIPLELYTGSLWQQAVLLVDRNKDDDALQQSILASIDIFRLFSLTMGFILLYIPLGKLKYFISETKFEANLLEAYIIFIALFLSANWIWNQILFRNFFVRRTGQKTDLYDEILRKHQDVMDTKVNKINGILSNQEDKEFLLKQLRFNSDFTAIFGRINRFIFQWVFLVIFVLLFAFAVGAMLSDWWHDRLLLLVGWISLGIFGLQIIAKLIQIIFFSNAVSDIRSAEKVNLVQGVAA